MVQPTFRLLNTAISYLYDHRGNVQSPLSCGATMLFVPKVISVALCPLESNSFVPIYFFSCPEITQYPESIFIFSFLTITLTFLAKKNGAFLFSVSRRKKLCTMKVD